VVAWGGYPQQNDNVCAREEVPLEQGNVEVATLEIAGNFLLIPPPRLLGAMGTGIVRDKTGDIIVLGERGAQAIVVPELVEFLEMNLQVRSVPVKTQRITLSELKIQEPRKELTSRGFAAARCDRSAGFGMSRQNGRLN